MADRTADTLRTTALSRLATTRKTPPVVPTGPSHLIEPGGIGSTESSSTGGPGVDCD